MKDIYEECPMYETKIITLRQTNMEDAEGLLTVYSDEKAVPFFNSDNCNGDDFHYTTIERMKQAIEFWNLSYKNRHFVRWTVIFNETNKIIGTVEMFRRVAGDEFNHYGVLRIDLQSNFEVKSVINAILEIVNENFYEDFEVQIIVTKAIPAAVKRISSLTQNGFRPINRKFMIYDNYFVNEANDLIE